MDHNQILVDTSILIEHLRKKRKDQTTFFKATNQYECYISSVTEFEFAVGTTEQNRVFVKQLLAQLPVLPFDSVCAQTAAEIYQTLKSKNQLISVPDIFIVATALAHDIPLQTLNVKHFARVEQLQLNIVS
ncbi:MAG: type II toxin-antitoxin system VapC family toxin [Chloroflexota bacterium]